jgi:hypothetical protein
MRGNSRDEGRSTATSEPTDEGSTVGSKLGMPGVSGLIRDYRDGYKMPGEDG